MANVSAPYNFVPLNKEVFFPPWANLVNHDIPFKDGLSGQIELEITAETPIFIRGKEEVNDENPDFKQYRFPKKDDRYYIPGSSIKGEISNVLEIMSFSKLRFFNDVNYSQREFNNSKIYKKQDFANVLGGWLSVKNNGDYFIEYNINKPGRIKHNELNKLKSNFSRTYSNNGYNKDAKHKYKLTDCINGNTVNFITKKFICQYNQNLRKDVCSIENNGNDGTIVFTGQSSNRRENAPPNRKGKGYEFVFWKPNINVTLKPDDIRIRSFKIAYDDGNKSKESIDWKMWKNQLKKEGKVPIFITLKDKQIAHFGLSMLYKLPYERSIKEVIKNVSEKHFDNRKDFSETLFGNIKDTKLKGRVHFSHALSSNDAQEFDNCITTVLGGPKPTFYPFYIKQNFNVNSNGFHIKGDYLTFNKGEIAGRKRYPTMKRNTAFYIKNTNIFDIEKTKSTTTFLPLKEGAKFTCKITFHNLLNIELGGLLSALTFHNNADYNHRIGMGKPLGLGSVKIKINALTTNDIDEKENINKYLCSFEKSILTKVDNWSEREQLKELFALATPISENRKEFAYLELNIPGENEFATIKEEKKALPRYSKFMDLKNIKIKSLATINTKPNRWDEITEITENLKSEMERNLISQKQKIKDLIIQIDTKINTKNERLRSLEQGLIITDIANFGDLKNKINEYMTVLKLSETEVLPINEHEKIITKVTFFQKKKKPRFRQGFTLKIKEQLEKWIGKDVAEEWFNSTTKNN